MGTAWRSLMESGDLPGGDTREGEAFPDAPAERGEETENAERETVMAAVETREPADADAENEGSAESGGENEGSANADEETGDSAENGGENEGSANADEETGGSIGSGGEAERAPDMPSEPSDPGGTAGTVEKQPYLGSVKFFKNMILLVVVIAIAVPTYLCFQLQREWEAAAAETAVVLSEKDELQTQYDALAAELAEKQAIWGGSVAEHVVQSAPLDYQTMYPDFYVTEPLGEVVEDENVMYLTFDDGPSSNTPLLLSILRANDVKATFFVVGGNTERQREWMKEIADDGHTLGMHSYSHNYHTIYESVESFLDDYYKLFTCIEEATGQKPTVFRFPGGSVNSYNNAVYREIIAEMLRRGFVFFDWNLSSGDASGSYISPKRITENVLRNAADCKRGIILFHDAASKDSTVEALSGVIRGLREQGFTFGALSREVRPILFNYSDYQKD